MISQNSIKDDISNLVRRSYLLSKKYLIPSKYKMGNDFFKILAQLEESQWWSKDQIINYQWNNIKALLDHAYNNVPYYQNLFNQEDIHPEDIKTLTDFEKIPYLTKKNIQDNSIQLLAGNIPRNKIIKKFTGGTTGAPVDFYEEKLTQTREDAFFWRFWHWLDYHLGDKCSIMRGLNKTKKHRHNPYSNYLEMACSELSENNIITYLDKLIKFKPSFIQAYPSIVQLVAQYINKTQQNGTFDFIRVVFCASEKLFAFQRDQIKKAFNCRVIDHYGHSERAVMIHQCEKGDNLHIIPEYGYTEFIDMNDTTVKEPGQSGEIVATGFNNYAFPFIRYRTGDYAILARNVCNCGRKFDEVREISGRTGDYIITSKGKVSPTVIEFAFDPIRHVKEWQVIQRSRDLIEILLVQDKGFLQETEEILKRKLQEVIGEKIHIKITHTDSLERSTNMKHRFVQSAIKD